MSKILKCDLWLISGGKWHFSTFSIVGFGIELLELLANITKFCVYVRGKSKPL